MSVAVMVAAAVWAVVITDAQPPAAPGSPALRPPLGGNSSNTFGCNIDEGNRGNTTVTVSATVPPHGVVVYRVRTGSAPPTESFRVRGAGSGRCLDKGRLTQIVTAASGQLGIGGSVWDTENNGTAVDVSKAATADNTPLIPWTWSGAANRRWTRP